MMVKRIASPIINVPMSLRQPSGVYDSLLIWLDPRRARRIGS